MEKFLVEVVDLREIAQAFEERFGKIFLVEVPTELFVSPPDGSAQLKLELSPEDVGFINREMFREGKNGG